MEDKEQKQQQKACLLKEHDNNYITMICLDKDCKQQSRTLCCRCLYEQKHQNCQQTLLCKDFRSYQMEQCYKEYAQQMNSIYEYLKTRCSKAMKEVENKFQEIIEQMQQKMYKLMKEEKIRIQEGFESIKKQCEKIDFFRKIERQSNLEYIQQQLDLFLKNDISIQKFNEIIKDQQKDYFSLDEMKQIQAKFGQTKKLYSNFKPNKEMLETINDLIQQIYDNSLYIIKQQQNINEEYEYNNRFELCNRFKNFGFIQQDGSYRVNALQNFTIVSKDSFKLDDKVKFWVYFKNASQQKGEVQVIIVGENLQDFKNQCTLYLTDKIQSLKFDFQMVKDFLQVNDKVYDPRLYDRQEYQGCKEQRNSIRQQLSLEIKVLIYSLELIEYIYYLLYNENHIVLLFNDDNIIKNLQNYQIIYQ